MSDPARRWSDASLDEFRKEFREHREEEERRWGLVLSAFPGEDPVEHRKYHEAVMRAAEAQEKFWNELRLDLAKKSVWGLLIILVGLVIFGLAAKTGINLKGV